MTNLPSQDAPQTTPLYIITWRLPARSKERRHMALFSPTSADLTTTTTAASPNPSAEDGSMPVQVGRGTLLQVVGYPFTGFAHSFVHDFDPSHDKRIEKVVRVGQVHEPAVEGKAKRGTGKEEGDRKVAKLLEDYADRVQAPGVARRPWIAEEIINCQDWVLMLTEYFLHRKVIEPALLENVRALIEPKVAVMAAHGGSRQAVVASMGPFGSMASWSAEGEETVASAVGHGAKQGDD